jgi:hypothetical protein
VLCGSGSTWICIHLAVLDLVIVVPVSIGKWATTLFWIL